MLTTTLLLLAAGTSGAPAPVAADTAAMRASFVHVGNGTVLENAVLVVKDGKVVSVGKPAPEGVTVQEIDGHIAPGFIALRDATGAAGETTESTRKLTPTVDLARAFDPHHPDWHRVLSQGITTVVLMPGSSRIAGGMAAAVSPGSGDVVKRGAALSLGLSSRSLSSGIEPTSYAGMYAHLRAAMGDAKEGGPMARAKAGELPVVMEAVSRVEVLRAASFAKENGLKGAVLGAPKAGEVVDTLKDAGLGVVFEPMSAGGAVDVVESAMKLAKEGVPFAFTADSTSRGAASMRMTVAACLRGGLSADHALSSMTRTAAQLAGIGKTHGTLEAGKAADFVIWSGTPTDLTSRVHSVYTAGALVHDASGHSH